MAQGIQTLFPVLLARHGAQDDQHQINERIAQNENNLNQNFEILYNGLSETKALIDANLDAMKQNITVLTQAVNAQQQQANSLQQRVSSLEQSNQGLSGAINTLSNQIAQIWAYLGF